jgi:Zn-dependent M32 family carboxypeptidase
VESRLILAKGNDMEFEKNYQSLKEILGEVSDIGRASAVLSWDQQTYMPRGGGAARGQQLATLRRIAHVKFTSDEVGTLLDELKKKLLLWMLVQMRPAWSRWLGDVMKSR